MEDSEQRGKEDGELGRRAILQGVSQVNLDKEQLFRR